MVRRIALIVAACGSAALIPQTATPSELLKGPGVIRITSVQLGFTRVDVGVPGVSPGDMEITRDLLYNTRIRKKPIGHSQLVCVYVDRQFRNCNGTYFLPAGRITVSGAVQFRSLYGLTVTGGTDFYNNAKGTVTVTLLHASPRSSLLVFRLVV